MVTSDSLEATESPRSTVIPTLTSVDGVSSVTRMTQNGGQGEDGSGDLKTPHPSDDGEPNGEGNNHAGGDSKSSPDANQETEENSKKVEGGLSPTPQMQANYLGYPAHLTPQGGQGYYQYAQSQVTPEPPSPAGHGATVYDVGSFFQQPAAFAPHSPFVPQTPLSPRRAGAMAGGIPPASPLFPRVSTATGGTGIIPGGSGLDQRIIEGHRGGAPPSPSVPYLSPPLGPNSMYHSYPNNGLGATDSPEDMSGWGDRNQQSMFPPGSPQVNAQGLPVPYVPGMNRVGNAGRSYSFEDSMLPPTADQQDQQGNPGYSPYGNNQNNSGGAGGTLFAHQQTWGYPGGPGDMYATPGSPLQQRPAAQMPVYPGQMGGGMRQQMGLYGQYYPATSPGPPIQTTESNKGPDGANLFIFHIPNHFTNLDMYQLFCPYGNLLSVRIMVEKDTGRSRGFGFVSYDAPASAALAIKELNGFAIGNKRLKVQHKQIRPSDQQHRDNSQGFYGGVGGGVDGNFNRSAYSHLPPSGPMAAQSMGPSSPWLAPPPQAGPSVGDDAGGAGQPVMSPNTGPPNPPGHDGVSDSTTGVVGAPDSGSGLSPLASLEPLRNALPDVPGTE